MDQQRYRCLLDRPSVLIDDSIGRMIDSMPPRRSVRGPRAERGTRMTWRMPAETAEQERVWLAYPRAGYTLGDDAASAELARDAWAAVANAAVEFEPVTAVVDA